MLKKFDPRLKVVLCPSCKQKLRIPIKFNNTLQISCKSCKTKFSLNFKNPLIDILKWNKQKNIFDNIKVMIKKFKDTDKESKKKIILIIALIFISTSMLINGFR